MTRPIPIAPMMADMVRNGIAAVDGRVYRGPGPLPALRREGAAPRLQRQAVRDDQDGDRRPRRPRPRETVPVRPMRTSLLRRLPVLRRDAPWRADRRAGRSPLRADAAGAGGPDPRTPRRACSTAPRSGHTAGCPCRHHDHAALRHPGPDLDPSPLLVPAFGRRVRFRYGPGRLHGERHERQEKEPRRRTGSPAGRGPRSARVRPRAGPARGTTRFIPCPPGGRAP